MLIVSNKYNNDGKEYNENHPDEYIVEKKWNQAISNVSK